MQRERTEALLAERAAAERTLAVLADDAVLLATDAQQLRFLARLPMLAERIEVDFEEALTTDAAPGLLAEQTVGMVGGTVAVVQGHVGSEVALGFPQHPTHRALEVMLHLVLVQLLDRCTGGVASVAPVARAHVEHILQELVRFEAEPTGATELIAAFAQGVVALADHVLMLPAMRLVPLPRWKRPAAEIAADSAHLGPRIEVVMRDEEFQIGEIHATHVAAVVRLEVEVVVVSHQLLPADEVILAEHAPEEVIVDVREAMT